jgi:hypothetical protein
MDKASTEYYVAELCLIGVVSVGVAVLVLVLKETAKNRAYRAKLRS